MKSSLPSRALWTGVFLIIISTLAVMASSFSPTALIPGTIGLGMGLLALWADRNPTQAPLAMNSALGLAALAMLGSARAVPDFLSLLGGATLERPVATMAQFATFFMCFGFGVRWLVERLRKPNTKSG